MLSDNCSSSGVGNQKSRKALQLGTEKVRHPQNNPLNLVVPGKSAPPKAIYFKRPRKRQLRQPRLPMIQKFLAPIQGSAFGWVLASDLLSSKGRSILLPIGSDPFRLECFSAAKRTTAPLGFYTVRTRQKTTLFVDFSLVFPCF